MDYHAVIVILALFLLWFGSDFSKAFRSWNEGRNKRLLKEQDHKQEMEKLAVKKELLLLDPNYEEQFDQKLRVAIKSNKEKLSLDLEEDITVDEKSQMRK